MHLYTAIKVAGAVNDDDDFEGGLFVINHIYGSYIVPIYGSHNVFTYRSYVVCRHIFILYLYTDHFYYYIRPTRWRAPSTTTMTLEAACSS